MLSKSYTTLHYKILWFAGYPLIAISFIFFASDNSFYTLTHLPSFYSDLIFSLVVTFAVGLYVHRITKHFDEKLPWYQDFNNRLLRQFFVGVLIPLLISMVLEVVYLHLINIPLQSSSILNLELPLAFVFLLLVNLFYMVVYLFTHKKTQIITVTEQVAAPPQQNIAFVTIQAGFREERLDIKHCALILSSNKILCLYTYTGAQHRLQGTLDEWEKKLCGSDFYRLNRQCIAALNAIQSVEATDTRKLKVNFVVECPEVFVSKTNVTSFRKWWKQKGPL